MAERGTWGEVRSGGVAERGVVGEVRSGGVRLSGVRRLYEAVRQRERWIDGSVAVTTVLLSGGDADEVLQVVAEQARRLSGAAAGIVPAQRSAEP